MRTAAHRCLARLCRWCRRGSALSRNPAIPTLTRPAISPYRELAAVIPLDQVDNRIDTGFSYVTADGAIVWSARPGLLLIAPTYSLAVHITNEWEWFYPSAIELDNSC